MWMRESRFLASSVRALMLCAVAAAGGDSLTVYRIGGSAPDVAPGVDAVHIAWAEAASGYGSVNFMTEAAGSGLAPVFLDSTRNIALDAYELGFGAFGTKYPARTSTDAHRNAIDGDPTTAFTEEVVLSGREWPLFGVEFGGLLPVNRIVFYPTTDNQDRFIEYYRLFVYDGDKAKLVDPWRFLGVYSLVELNDRNREPRVEVTIPTRLLHTVVLAITDPAAMGGRDYKAATRPWEVAEFEIYGDGYAPISEYTTRILDLGSASSVGDMRWAGRKDRDARVEIRTRSGSDRDPLRYWRQTGRGDDVSARDDQGNPLTREQYLSLNPTQQQGTTHDADNWTFWSAPYAFADSTGTQFRGEGPNQFVQLQIDFVSIAHAGSKLSYVEFDVTSPPVVHDAVGEVAPVLATAGEETAFVYAFRPSFTLASTGEGVESGFDRLLLTTPGELTGVDSVRVNGERIDCEVMVGSSKQPCDVVVGSPVEFQLPRMDFSDSGKLVEVFFRGRVFRYGTVFDGELLDSERPGEVGQSVVAGDASFNLDSNRLSVGVDLSGELLQQVEVSSPAITPNGDGVNDEVEFEYTVLQLASGQRVTIDVFDLAGNHVGQVYEGVEASGRQERHWDGRGDAGLLTPGVYVYRIEVDADAGNAVRTGVISVVY